MMRVDSERTIRRLTARSALTAWVMDGMAGERALCEESQL